MTDDFRFYIPNQPLLAEPYHLRGLGLPNVYLLNGVAMEHDAEHGELVTVMNMSGLMRAVGLRIISRPERMTGAEFRFLRKQMELTQPELALRLGVDVQTVANYEKENTKRIGVAARLIAWLYVLHVVPDETSAGTMKKLVVDGAGEEWPDVPRRKIAGKWRKR